MYRSLFLSSAKGLLLPVVFSASLCAQNPAPPSTGGGGAPGNPGTGNPGQGTGNMGTRVPTQPQRNPMEERIPTFENRPIYLSGKVLMEDGTPPPESVVIERVCNGRPKPEGYTDSKGRFSFELGRNQSMFADASVGNDSGDFGAAAQRGGQQRGLTERDLNSCEIRANLAGFRSTIVNLAGRRSLDNPDIGTIILQRLAKVEGFTFSGTSLNASKEAKKAYEKGLSASKKKKLEDAEQHLKTAVELHPKYAVAWYELGTVYERQNKPEDAKKSYLAALDADAKFVNPYPQLARLAVAEKKWEESAGYSSTLIKLNPYVSPDVYFISGVAHLNANKLDVAEEHAREAVKLDPQMRNGRAIHLLGIILAQKREYAPAAEQMRAFLKTAPNGPDVEKVKAQLLELEHLMGQTQGASTNAPTQ